MRLQAFALLEELEAQNLGGAGFAFMAGGPLFGKPEDRDPTAVPALRATFLEKLAWFEGKLAEAAEGVEGGKGGPWILGASMSLLDVMAMSYMERIGAGLAAFRGFDIRWVVVARPAGF